MLLVSAIRHALRTTDSLPLLYSCLELVTWQWMAVAWDLVHAMTARPDTASSGTVG